MLFGPTGYDLSKNMVVDEVHHCNPDFSGKGEREVGGIAVAQKPPFCETCPTRWQKVSLSQCVSLGSTKWRAWKNVLPGAPFPGVMVS